MVYRGEVADRLVCPVRREAVHAVLGVEHVRDVALVIVVYPVAVLVDLARYERIQYKLAAVDLDAVARVERLAGHVDAVVEKVLPRVAPVVPYYRGDDVKVERLAERVVYRDDAALGGRARHALADLGLGAQRAGVDRAGGVVDRDRRVAHERQGHPDLGARLGKVLPAREAKAQAHVAHVARAAVLEHLEDRDVLGARLDGDERKRRVIVLRVDGVAVVRKPSGHAPGARAVDAERRGRAVVTVAAAGPYALDACAKLRKVVGPYHDVAAGVHIALCDARAVGHGRRQGRRLRRARVEARRGAGRYRHDVHLRRGGRVAHHVKDVVGPPDACEPYRDGLREYHRRRVVPLAEQAQDRRL